jgi:NADH-ubiquinone oxidoreductase chain 3
LPFLVGIITRITLAALLASLGLALGSKLISDREKARPFECGFTPKSSARLPFSIRFFLLSIVFLIFDVELILIFPIIPALSVSPSVSVLSRIFLVILILIIGLLHEALCGRLTWAE